jgi:signal transduction histidine kinase/ActR/RegA family two-component response regulator
MHPPARHVADPAAAEAVYAEQIRLILAHTAAGALAATAFAVLMVFKIAHGALGIVVPSAILVGWLALKIAVVLPRVVHQLHCKRLERQGKRPPYEWTIPLLALDGAIFGMGGAYMMTFTGEVATIVAAMLCCIACVATFGLQVRASAAAAYVAPMLAPVAIALLARDDSVGLIGGIGLGLFLALLLTTSRRWQRRMEEVTLLRLETERVSQERAEARDLAESSSHQLAEALALAERHSEAKDRFLAVVSHELRTPLHGILGLTRMTRQDTPREQVQLHYRLELIDEAAEHLQRMVSDLLDISAIEAGRLELKHEPMDLQRELTLLRGTWSARADEIGVRLIVDVEAGVGRWVNGDAVRVMQVLGNLVGNAFKFTPLGGSIEVQVARPQQGDSVSFKVRDSGPGVPMQDVERIFEAFVQGRDPSGSRPDGVGLGLAISRQLARAMGGDVQCTSTVGSGATFEFTAELPVLRQVPQEARGVFIGTRARQTPGRIGAGKTVLIVDDDSSSRLVAATALRQLGCEVEEIEDGVRLLKRVKAGRRPAAVVLDWDMPGLDGCQAALAIREHEAAKGLDPVPIVGLSANAAPEFASRAMQAGMDEFLVKPCSPVDLAEVVRGHLEQRVDERSAR